jgi:hypothetical protein
MDFVASRAAEKAGGWRTRVGGFLRQMGVIIFDPWEKPEVRGLHEYGVEGEKTTSIRDQWTYEKSDAGADKRAAVGEAFWPALHIDLRMVDTSDFIVCYCPTNIYSVGTPNEIILARSEFKPVLFVSPHVFFPELEELRRHLQGDEAGTRLLNTLAAKVPIKENTNASPSSWYTSLMPGEYFFDGFGFEPYKSRFQWPDADIDLNERAHCPDKPLLPFLEELNHKLPQKWDREKKTMIPDPDWLLWDLKEKDGGGQVHDSR